MEQNSLMDNAEGKKITEIDIWLNGQIEDFLTISYGGLCENCISNGAKVVTIYVVLKKDINTCIVMKVFDRNDTEIGRSEVIAKGAMDDASYIDFKFDSRTPFTKLAYCSIQFKEVNKLTYNAKRNKSQH